MRNHREVSKFDELAIEMSLSIKRAQLAIVLFGTREKIYKSQNIQSQTWRMFWKSTEKRIELFALIEMSIAMII